MSGKLVTKCQANLKEWMSFARIDSTILSAKSANFIVIIICNGHRSPPPSHQLYTKIKVHLTDATACVTIKCE